MSQIGFLVAVLLMRLVSGRGIVNLRDKARGERDIAEITASEQGQENIVCGQKQIQTSKRDEEIGGLNIHDDSDHLDKILGGSDVTHGDVPWQANYYNNGSHRCGGAIISEYWVLTTASCVYHHHDSPYLVVGDNQLSQSDAGQQTFDIVDIMVPTRFTYGALDYNLALLKVIPQNGRGILFNNYVQPICLPGPGEGPTDDDRLTLSGWGNDTTARGLTTDRLRKVVLAVMNKQECTSLLRGGTITSRMLCTFLRPNSCVCFGDYGGPATYKIGDSHILVGLISASGGCQNPRNPVILTDVLGLRDFIHSVINQYSNTTERLIPSRSG